MTLKAFYIRYSVWAAVLNTACTLIYLFAFTYTNVWILYIGNVLFNAVILAGVIKGNARVHENASVRSMFMMGIKLTVYGILITTALCLVLLLIHSLVASTTSSDVPAQAGRGDILFTIFSTTIAVNAVVGALTSIIGASVAKSNQKTEEGKNLY